MNTNTRTRSEKDAYFRYLDEISKYPLLTKEQEYILLRKIQQQGSRSAMEMLVNSNLRFVVNIANLYKGQGVDVIELINEGNMGLMHAAKRFDLSTNLKFISYAVWWVRQNIVRHIAENGRIVRISAEKELVIRKFSKHGGILRQNIGGTLSIDPKSLEGVSKYKADSIEKILMMAQRSSSLDAPLSTNQELTLGDTLSDSENKADNLAAYSFVKKHMDKAMKDNLSEEEMRVIKLCFGFDRDIEYTLKDIGPMVGLSKERVRQIKKAALDKLRGDYRTHDLHGAA